MTNKTDKFDNLIRLLEKELKLTGTEIAENLWLAMRRQYPSSVDKKIPSKNQITTGEKVNTTISSTRSSTTQFQDSFSPKIPENNSYAEVTPKTNSTSSNKSDLSIKAPDVSSLRHPLKIASAFRPLMEYISYGKAVLLDEKATVENIAQLEGLCVPILKYPLELQFDLALVVDQSDSMIFWDKNIQELQQLFKRYGIFRNVKTWRILTDTNGKICLKQGIKQNPYSHHLFSPQKLIDPTGRRLILVVSDCVSKIWRNGQFFSLLKTWGKYNIVAIIQVLPRRLWLRTALSLGAMVQLDCLQPRVPNSNLLVREVFFGSNDNLQTGIKVPVFSLEPELIETWSEMVVGKGIIGAGGFVFSSLLKLDQNQTVSDQERANLTGEKRLYNFKMSSSKTAQKLAEYLSAAPVINLPIVRSIQKNFLRDSQQVHVAEVFLGNILKPQSLITPDIDFDQVQYQFIDEEIRDILLKDSPRKNAQEIITMISQDFANRLGNSPREFLALLKKPDELERLKTERNVLDLDVKYFATVATKVLKRLGGPYADFAREIERSQNEISENVEGKKLPKLENQVFAYKGKKLPKENQVFAYKTPTVNRRGEVINTTAYIAPYFREFLADGINLEMVAIPGGTFTMGSPESEKGSRDRERPQHNVTVSPFFMGKYPVTQGQWRAIASRTDLKVELDLNPEPSTFKEPYQGIDRWQRPVENVNCYEAVEFCQRLSKLTGRNYRLPSEAEWEYACRAETEVLDLGKGASYPPFSCGETITGELANYDASVTYADEPKGEYREQTTPVGKFSANGFGLYDMHGNVREWCGDEWHENYNGAPVDGSVWLDGNKNRSPLRGGSWSSGPDKSLSAYCSEINMSYSRFNNTGFRVLCSVRKTFVGSLKREGVSFPSDLEVFHYEYTTPTVDRGGKIIKQDTKFARYFRETIAQQLELEMVAILGGTFTMGSPKSEEGSYDDERPQHNVTVSPFFMGKYPVTQGQWRAIASRTDLKVELDLNPEPSAFKEPYQGIDRWQRPVEAVSWYKAVEFCKRLSKLTGRNYRLPSEAEWEYACRAQRKALGLGKGESYPPFSCGETITGELANYNASVTYADEPKGEHRKQTTPVGQFSANGFGLYDMHGNVWEWCGDEWHDNYRNAPIDGSTWLNGDKQRSPLRGGSWYVIPIFCRSAVRLLYLRRGDQDIFTGFRLVCDGGRTL
ncbi:MAG: formylglycine-generating enzyme family protein [Trichodesmium sp. St18_bin3_1_1]|nr:formylglycine-generating enzyme family protein [Trichodesmium sp. St18_bin3_1_1]